MDSREDGKGVSLLEYIRQFDSLVFLDEVNRLAECGRPWKRNTARTMKTGWKRDRSGKTSRRDHSL